jgi:hypothetical protein
LLATAIMGSLIASGDALAASWLDMAGSQIAPPATVIARIIWSRHDRNRRWSIIVCGLAAGRRTRLAADMDSLQPASGTVRPGNPLLALAADCDDRRMKTRRFSPP